MNTPTSPAVAQATLLRIALAVTAVILIVLALPMSSNAAVTTNTLFGTRGSSAASDLYSIDPATGVSTTIGPIGMAVTGLAYNATTDTLYGVTTPASPVSPLSLITIDTATGAPTVVGSLLNSSSSTETIAEIEYDGTGALWGWSESGDHLVQINTATGALTDFPNFIGTAGDGMAWIPASDTLWFMPSGSSGNYYSIDRSTGNVTMIGTLSFSGSGSQISAATQSCDGLTTFALIQGTPAQLVTVDYSTGVVTLVGPTTMNNGDGLTWACPAVAPPAPTPVTPAPPAPTPATPKAPKIYSLGNGAMKYCAIASGNCRVKFTFSVSQASTVTLKITRLYGRRETSQCKTVNKENHPNGICSIGSPTYTRTVKAKSGKNSYTFTLPKSATRGHYTITAQAKNTNGKSSTKKHNFSVPWG